MIENTLFILTRPIQQSEKLAASLEKLGGQCLLFPTICIKRLSDKKITQQLFTCTYPLDEAIFTSANAVHPLASKITATKTFAIGPGTAAALKTLNIDATLPEDQNFNSEGLLKLPDLESVKNHNIAIFSGVGGRNLLLTELNQRGAFVKKIEIYKRKKTKISLSHLLKSVDYHARKVWIICASTESLKNLYEITTSEEKIWLYNQHLLVINQKGRSLAQEMGFKLPIVAGNASDDAILNTIGQNLRAVFARE